MNDPLALHEPMYDMQIERRGSHVDLRLQGRYLGRYNSAPDAFEYGYETIMGHTNWSAPLGFAPEKGGNGQQSTTSGVDAKGVIDSE